MGATKEKKRLKSVSSSNKRVGQFKADKAHTLLLVEIGKLSAERSIRENKALGLPITYLEGDTIIKEHADGRMEVIGKLDA